MTRLRVGRSMPRAATSVATHTRARRSRSACSAWLRSFWLCSPDSATAAKPRLTNRAWRRRTLSRVAQNSIAVSARSEEHTSELQSLMRISYAVFCLKKKKKKDTTHNTHQQIHTKIYE